MSQINYITEAHRQRRLKGDHRRKIFNGFTADNQQDDSTLHSAMELAMDKKNETETASKFSPKVNHVWFKLGMITYAIFSLCCGIFFARNCWAATGDWDRYTILFIFGCIAPTIILVVAFLVLMLIAAIVNSEDPGFYR